jgi:hypothetical protein
MCALGVSISSINHFRYHWACFAGIAGALMGF